MTNKQENSSIFSVEPQRTLDSNNDKTTTTTTYTVKYHNIGSEEDRVYANLTSTLVGRAVVSERHSVQDNNNKTESKKFNDAGVVSDDGVGPVGHASTGNEGGSTTTEDNGRERLKRHRVEVAGRVWIPEIWGQEELLKDWIDCSAFDKSLMNNNIMSARAALVEDRSRANSTCRLRIENSC
ncbi:hypothetical protein K7X08_015624 [Anisodus acutangulus]|uniref:Protein BIC1 n=1 Tax=Anisodus acutangulus TaxID=402998 RepID=A0A9Q1LEI0_9SOLA|nr:hypothetical protein K7X08_015624 [Anisodus acutangulus]